ncbi:S41 family peptidase [Slackia heliotrinireducens]|uniref:C-terminal processing peptidase n=1 Tax=Slackia heliotrinireducens (strain ATCC 29202 / DSM 20476 / NCTC 11029 / RHS 1) TaxID=471855 RepID=C7N4W6_SLAHD|nr:S41 family peptidase [Slackia heliotrinireducens]ACV21951.1 C-terminal processing peptidase [Slackia heliotrinireducens DSM 20476]VEG99800.1 Probable CtpA-like serine protease [Slackia heliotrinireducens]
MQHSAPTKHIDKSTRDKKIVKLMLVFICACALFAAGFTVRGYAPLMDRLGFQTNADPSKSAELAPEQIAPVARRVNEVDGVLSSGALHSYDDDDATRAAIEAFLTSTGDPFAHYYDSNRYTTYVTTSNANYPGVGVFFAEYNGQAYALDVFEGSSAAEAGVQSGDFVVAIDGDRSQTWTATEAINAVRRESGSNVVITWRRAQSLDSTEGEEYTTTLVTAEYDEPNVLTQLVGDVGYITLEQFTQNADAMLSQAIAELTDQGAKAFVLDLRDNPGGYLSKAVDVASLFIPSGVVVQIDTASTSSTRSVSGAVATDAPLVVLINGNTSGSAEVLVAALRDTGRATVAGTTSMGKGSVQIITPLSFGGAVRYTVAQYKSPSGYVIDGKGISPDVTIALGANSSEDNQKVVAIETAQSLISS